MTLPLDRTLKVGIQNIHRRTEPATAPWRPTIDELAELVGLVDGCGYDSLWVGDHLAFPMSILDPLLMGLIYFVIFGFVFHRGGVDDQPYILFLLMAVLPWTWFNGNLSDATRAFRQEGKLIRSVKIPRSIWILRQIASKGIEFLISLSIIVFFALINWTAPSPWTFVYLPLAILLQILLTVGCNFIIAPIIGSGASPYPMRHPVIA